MNTYTELENGYYECSECDFEVADQAIHTAVVHQGLNLPLWGF